MDKYEYNLKLDQMKSRYAEEKYDEAADIADTINWNKVKNVNGLVKAGEVYEKVQRYEESREVLLMAYDPLADRKNDYLPSCGSGGQDERFSGGTGLL